MLCDVCWQMIYIGDDGHEHCGCEEDCPCGCAGNPDLCVYAPSNTRLQADVCPVCDGTGYVPVSWTIQAECKACNGTGHAAKA